MSSRYNLKNLHKHGINIHEVDEVLAHPATRTFDLPGTQAGGYRVMFVGFTAGGRFLEIGIEQISDDTDYVFHANDATRYYRSQF